ncbi:uncharacterized protein M421DRAFT_425522 [Didymella exigua CBS 183.55]|uniref:HTH psq-type domain-containing protein n=1 Tax=Didymella exigua CBS 183.55 TaxID=1150837 RepID=A0A6A5RDN3_9PLEO|nr:uncharacterized protein M421DRAFT_425522 [Didymella exigua CBS 183.55]KAF1923827.1 hypothetical protein M421DRAFT_425522 [Didymella exigua CBS 183.55]
MQLALQAIQQDTTLSLQRAAAIYRVLKSTLRRRRAGQPSRADSMANLQKLDSNKERVIV